MTDGNTFFSVRIPTALMAISGVLYFSWPLGYLLNPQANHGLASDLGALHQPYNWLFISLDVGCGILILLSTVKLFEIISNNYTQPNLRWLKFSVLGASGFGLLTAITAVMPLNCTQGSPNCEVALDNPYFVIHGIFSTGSVTSLAFSIFFIWFLLPSRERSEAPLAYRIPAIFLVVWLGFGTLTLFLVLQNRSSTLSQRLFIGTCSLWLAVLPYFVGSIIRMQPKVTHTN